VSESAVQDILKRIKKLSAEDRAVLEDCLAQLAESEWQGEAAQARKLAAKRGLNQAAIDQVIEAIRYGS
jgi:hypothetical protein